MNIQLFIILFLYQYTFGLHSDIEYLNESSSKSSSVLSIKYESSVKTRDYV